MTDPKHDCRAFVQWSNEQGWSSTALFRSRLSAPSPRVRGEGREEGAVPLLELRGDVCDVWISIAPLKLAERPPHPRCARPLPARGERWKIHPRSRGAPSRPSYTDDQANKRRPLVIFVRRRRWWDRWPSRSCAGSSLGIERSVIRAWRRSNPDSVPPTWIFAAPRSAWLRTKKGKRNAERRCSTTAAPHGAARAPCGGALASRRSTTALAAATERHRSARATRLPGTCSERPPRWFERRSASQHRREADGRPPCVTRGRYPRLTVPVQRDCTRSPVMMPVRACLAQAAREPR